MRKIEARIMQLEDHREPGMRLDPTFFDEGGRIRSVATTMMGIARIADSESQQQFEARAASMCPPRMGINLMEDAHLEELVEFYEAAGIITIEDDGEIFSTPKVRPGPFFSADELEREGWGG